MDEKEKHGFLQVEELVRRLYPDVDPASELFIFILDLFGSHKDFWSESEKEAISKLEDDFNMLRKNYPDMPIASYGFLSRLASFFGWSPTAPGFLYSDHSLALLLSSAKENGDV